MKSKKFCVYDNDDCKIVTIKYDSDLDLKSKLLKYITENFDFDFDINYFLEGTDIYYSEVKTEDNYE